MSDTPSAAPAVPATPAAAVPAEQPSARLKPKDDGAAPAKGPDEKFGMSFWGTGALVAGIASDLAKPVADAATPLLIAFTIGAAVSAYFAYVKKPPLRWAKTAVGAFGLGVGVFAFFLIARTFAAPAGLGEERGFIAAVAPPVAAVQTAVLPLTPVEKQLLVFTTQISTGDPEVRSAAARAGLAAATDPPSRRALLERALRNSDANVRQAALVQALADRNGAPLPVLPDVDAGAGVDAAAEAPLVRLLTGGQLVLTQVDLVSGAVGGTANLLGSSRPLSGTVANGRLIASSQYLTNRNRWAAGLQLDLAIDDSFKLVGTARSPEGDEIAIEAPLL